MNTQWSRRALLGAAGGMAVAGCARLPPAVPTASSPTVARSSPPPAVPSSSPTSSPSSPSATTSPTPREPAWPTRKQIVTEFSGRKPGKFDIVVPGVVDRGHRGIALTFDACGGGRRGDGYDAKLIALLERREVPATLFLNSRWIAANPRIAADLAANPLFELANHGWEHRPLTVAGQAAYGIKGTRGPGGAYDEIMRGMEALIEVTEERSPYFRPGTAWCDDVAVELAARLGVSIVAFDINGDAGATASKAAVATNIGKAREGSIVLAHFNRPEKHTAEGLAKALPRLLDADLSFVTLSDALA